MVFFPTNKHLHPFLLFVVVGFRLLCSVPEFLFMAAKTAVVQNNNNIKNHDGDDNIHLNLPLSRHLRAAPAPAPEAARVPATMSAVRRDVVPSFSVVKKKPGRFYIYDDPVITQSHVVERFRSMGDSAWISRRDHTRADAWSEQMVLEKLMEHPMRTQIRDEASIFIVPTPIAELLGYGCGENEECTWYDQVVDALQKQPSWNGGHNHVLISFHWLNFNPRYSLDVPSLSRNYRRLENVTVAHHYDPYGALELSRRMSNDDDDGESGGGGYGPLFQLEQPITKAFSIGLSIGKAFDLQSPDSKNRTKFLFYHTRSTPFVYNSTVYRRAPLQDDVVAGLLSSGNSSSIGYDVEYDAWVHDMTQSQYCLVVRGDTPHSHSLLNAVRAGCIPILVSDFYQTYAGPFKSTLQIEDFAIVIKEKDFVEDPLGQLLAVRNLTKVQVQEKRRKLAEAQRVFPDHPDSILGEAFIREAERAQDQVPPHLVAREHIHALRGSATISGQNYDYRYPSSMVHPAYPRDSTSKIVVGALSFSLNFWKRQSVRVTWGQGQPVYFVVAGPWEQIEEEFYTYGDLLWLDIPENYYEGLTPKTQVFLHAVNEHVKDYDYVLKTDDDAYLGMDVIDRIMAKHKPEYWGSCVAEEKWRHPHRDTSDKYYVSTQTFAGDLFPVWAQGYAYTISPTFLKCAAAKFATAKFMSMEDVATGMVAEACNVPCRSDDFGWWSGPDKGKKTPMVALHYVTTAEYMSTVHWNELRKRGITG